jgi:2-polyprenyl-6-methoxyphenol hydroxylase-like FAD-dependent oxidoreductase
MSTEQKQPQKILIVGGGTAGWMTANLILKRWKGVEITLVESKDIGIIGVGEGSTPHLKFFFDEIGLKESEWMPQCHATYKNGITFDHWSTIPGFESYFHPFPAQTDDIFTVPIFYENIKARLRGQNVSAHPDSQSLGPIPAETFPFGVAYGYHFDSSLLGKFLADRAVAKGVRRIFGAVDEVLIGRDDTIESIRLGDDSIIAADLFVDCSGFQSLLLQSALKIRFKSFKENLFNDAAVVMPTEISDVIPPETRSTALSNGWAWKIPLTNRYGNGYVYSTAYSSPGEAEEELRKHLGLLDANLSVRHLKMKVGRAEKHWEKNCVAVGLSQGFIEPLEATALALSMETITRFLTYFESGSYTYKFQDQFNREINEKFDGVRDYIVCHYKVNQRHDTSYWRDNALNTNISSNLKHVLHLWQSSDDFSKDMYAQSLNGSYQPKSWACLLAGYGVFPPLRNHTQNRNLKLDESMHQLSEFIRKCGLNFPKHNELLLRGNA